MKETIFWLMADSVKPDDSESVLIALANPDDEPVWVGWYDSSTNEWRCASSANVVGGVSYWAPMPRGPL
ncbi:hypothetical protein UFOVP73_17 [uncultured Caudovirales phage]|uniref:DUF551 domain-containing protein n=1 Tax=uncultured Caudovirales phage TaxID=2100421 RepID=A0A6J5KXP7_9CAUD|nr:hypothetical protein UFOVP73_17 [uncultured Caudovirales phage]CAB5195004.1 hypothetical protein UFOVP170_39 [uncultured Caudovirales phage]